jgi:N-acetylmuramoyl-L-alanine amidase
MRTLYIDLGHSTKFPGASGLKSEVLWVRSVWLELKKLLDTEKWNVVLVPDTFSWCFTSNSNLVKRIKYINSKCKDGDWVLSIHGNAATNQRVGGVTTCYMGGSEYMRKQAVRLSTEYSKATGIKLFNGGAFDDRTSRYGQLGMVRQTRPPALLVECGFVTNKEDMNILPQQAAKGIATYFNLL